MTNTERIKAEMEELLSDINSKRTIYPALYLNGQEDVERAVLRLIDKIAKEGEQ